MFEDSMVESQRETLTPQSVDDGVVLYMGDAGS